MAAILAITLRGAPASVFVDFGSRTTDPGHLCVRHGEGWLPVLSCRDIYGDEVRDDLTSANLAEMTEQLGGAG